MAKKYCPNCHKEVDTHMTAGQVLLFVILLLCGLIPGILYALFHSRKCPSCGARTVSRKNVEKVS